MDLDRSRTEALLLESIVENLPDMVFVKDADQLRFVRFNRAGETLLGWRRDSLIGRSDRDLFPAAEADFFTSKDREVLAGRKLVDIAEEPIHTATGLRWLHTKKIPILDAATGEALFLLGISRDVTELREARVELEEREAQLRVLLEHFPGVVWSTDAEGCVTWIGGARALRIGVAGAAGSRVAAVFPDPVHSTVGPPSKHTTISALHDAALAGTTADYTFAAGGLQFVGRMVPLPGRDRPAGTSSVRVVGVALDVTERHQLEAEKHEAAQLRAQRLEALGVFAGGIAHDFNNLLTGILGHASLAKALLPADSPVREHLDRIESVSELASGLTKQMLAYSGRGDVTVEPVDLGVLVRELSDLVSVTLGKDAHLSLDLAPDLPAVDADAGQLRQVVLNLLTNASDALDGQPGEIRVSTGLVHADEALLDTTRPELPVSAGDYVAVEVADPGSGMDDAVIARMFDPFFTTKQGGHGLGLAATLGIVRSHGGTIRVRSAPGRGTAMTVLLPARPDLTVAR